MKRLSFLIATYLFVAFTGTSSEAKYGCYASGRGRPFCTSIPCPNGYFANGFVNAGCATGTYYYCCPKLKKEKKKIDPADDGAVCRAKCGSKPSGGPYFKCMDKCLGRKR